MKQLDFNQNWTVINLCNRENVFIGRLFVYNGWERSKPGKKVLLCVSEHALEPENGLCAL